MSVFAFALSAQTSRGAEIFKCSDWTNSSLSHRGEVTVALDADLFTWRTETAQVVRIHSGHSGVASYVDDAFVYLILGALFLEFGGIVEADSNLIMVRRIPFVRTNPRIDEIECR